MAGKCEHGLTTKECLVCASAKYPAAPQASPPQGAERTGRTFTDWWMLQSKIPYRDKEEIAQSAWNAALATPPRAGFVIVPVELTPGMIDAAERTPGITAANDILMAHFVRTGTSKQGWPGDGTPLEQAWRAMLAAAGASPQVEQTGERED